MIKTKRTYTNKNGLNFEIEIETATEVPSGADYWGYHAMATEKGSQLRRPFVVRILRSLYGDEAGADTFVTHYPLTEMKLQLDTFDPETGKTEMFFPEFEKNGWAVN